jgi:hypothetical protein
VGVDGEKGDGWDILGFVHHTDEPYLAREVVFLENLVGEPTGHVDMFATFTAADTVVIGQYASEYDAVNAAILDRNAQRLSSSTLRGGPLKVARIPMPPRVPTPIGTELWPTYTNVAYANGILLVPVYRGWSPELEALAVKVYQRLLPDWILVLVNAVPALRAGGGIHCMNRQHSAVTAIWRLGGYVERRFDRGGDRPALPRWYRTLCGEDFMNPVVVVRLAGSAATDEDLSAVGRLADLQMLDLRDTRITDSGLEHLSRLERVEVLTLAGTAASDRGLVHLEGMPRLKVLCLEETSITDQGLAQLKNFPVLGWLNLSATGITDAGLRTLANFPALEVLIVDRCRVSPGAVDELRSAAFSTQVYDRTRRRPPFHAFSVKHFD